jgi:hypothetical protein
MKLRSLLALCPGAGITHLKKLGVTLAVASLVVGCSMSPTTPQTSQADSVKISGAKRMSPTMVSRSEISRFNPTDEQRAMLRSGDFANLSAKVVDMNSLPVNGPADFTGEAVVVGGPMIESKMSDEEAAAAAANAELNAPGTGMQVLADGSDNLAVNNEGNGKGSGKKGPKLRAVIDSIGAEDCCVDDVPYSATVPPDPDIAVGPDHVIAVVNVSFEIYDKEGNVLRPATSYGTLFAGVNPFGACEGPFTFDPDVIYDESIGQYIIGVDGGGAFYCIGITTDGDPTGTWNLYSFFASSPGFVEFFDFPHMGAGTDAIFVGSNQFTSGFAGGAVFAVSKDEMLSGGPLNVVRANVPNFDSTPQPATNFGAAEGTLPTSGANYIMTEVFDGRVHSVYQWNDPFGGGSLELVGDVNLADASGVPCDFFSCFPVSVPQAGSSVRLAGNDWRGQETRYRNGSLWTTQTISCNPTGEGAVNCVRWAEVDPTNVEPLTGLNGNGQLDASTNGVVQAGVFSSADGTHRWFPSIGVNACGQMAVGYSKSSETMFPSVALTGQRTEDQPGKVRGEVDVIAGTESYRSFQNPNSPNRWGDYSGMWVDPNGKDFWYIGEYAGPSVNPFTNWQNAIAKADFGCGFSKK